MASDTDGGRDVYAVYSREVVPALVWLAGAGADYAAAAWLAPGSIATAAGEVRQRLQELAAAIDHLLAAGAQRGCVSLMAA